MANSPAGYYDALITIWPTVPGATEQEKLDNLNAMTVPGPDKTAMLPPTEIINAFDPTEFDTLTSTAIQKLLLVLTGPTVDASKNSNVRRIILNIFTGKTQTLANFQAVAQKWDTSTIPWWQANGYLSPITHNDLVAAGLA